jgi:aspartate/methionine/tyrosine aminotransferase
MCRRVWTSSSGGVTASLSGCPDGRSSARPAGWSLLLDVAALGYSPEEASRLLLAEAAIAATGMTGWGDVVAARHVRLVFSAEPLERLRTLPERLAGGELAAAAATRHDVR